MTDTILAQNINFDQINTNIGLKSELTSPRGFIGALLPWLLIIAGLILFGMLVAGGFQILTSIGSPDGAEAGKKKISAAFVGFLILFCAYWLAQVLEIIFGFNILGSSI